MNKQDKTKILSIIFKAQKNQIASKRNEKMEVITKKHLEDFTRKLLENDLNTTIEIKEDVSKKVNGIPKYISPKDFGAKGDGVTDDTAAIQSALDFALNNSSTVILNGMSFATQTITIKDIKVKDGSFNIISGNIELTGRASIENISISRKDNALVWNGDVQLQNTNGCTIDNCSFNTLSRGFGVFCYTKAINTTIRDCVFNTGWGVLFDDDAVSHGFATSRTYDGVDYSGGSIGYGLTIEGCKFKTISEAFLYDGDNIEINTPLFRFSNIVCTNNISYGTKAIDGGGNGIGYGFANVDNAICSNNYLENVKAGGAIHFEVSTNITCNSNIINESEYGIMVIHTDYANISNNTINECNKGIWFTDAQGYPCNYVQCVNNILTKITMYGIVASQFNYGKIHNNIVNIGGEEANSGIINIENNSTFTSIKDNTLDYYGNSTNKVGIKTDGENNIIVDNIFKNIQPVNINADTSKNFIKHYVGGISGLLLYSVGDPSGMYYARKNGVAVDITTGRIYKSTESGTDWTLL